MRGWGYLSVAKTEGVKDVLKVCRKVEKKGPSMGLTKGCSKGEVRGGWMGRKKDETWAQKLERLKKHKGGSKEKEEKESKLPEGSLVGSGVSLPHVLSAIASKVEGSDNSPKVSNLNTLSSRFSSVANKQETKPFSMSFFSAM